MRALLVFCVVLLAGYSSALIPPKEQKDCANGGVFNKETSVCDCQSYWGEDDCSQIVCVNGGYVDNGFCHCPKGYYGIHCDAVKLARPVEGVFEAKKSFNLYIHNELTDWYGKEAFARIQRDVPDIIKDYGTTFTDYNLFVSDANTDVKLSFTNTNQTLFSNNLKEMGPTTTTKYYCGQSNIAYKSLLDALKKNTIEDSVVLMFTQYYPLTDDKEHDESLAELKKYLRAFRVKLNVLIGSDDILLDCNSKSNRNKDYFEELKSLAHFSDGEAASFLIEDEKTEDELLPSFIRASASPQSHARTASENCGLGAALTFQTDPYPNTYYIAVRSSKTSPASISGTCSSGGEVSDAIPSYYGEFSLFTIRSGAQQDCKLFVKANTECIATVYSVGGEPDVDSFDIFHSFATSADMDTDSISSYQEEEVFLTMHIEVPAIPKYKIKSFTGTVTVMNEVDEQVVVFEKNLTARSSTFEYQSEEQFPCPTDGASWIQLKLDGFTGQDSDTPVATLNRMIHLNCEQRTGPEAAPSKQFLRLMDDATPATQLSYLILMYSNRLPIQEFSNFILESVDAEVVQSRFSKFGYLRFDAAKIEDLSPLYGNSKEEFAAFKKAVYDNGPDTTLGIQENLKSYLEKLTATPSNSIMSDTLVSIAIQHSMLDPNFPGLSSNPYPENLNLLSNLGAKLLFVGNVDTVKIKEETDSLEEFTRLAAVSAGHVVLMDMTDFSDDGDNPFYVSLALHDLYSYGPSQRLLSYSNLEWEQTSTTTSQNKPIGTLQIPKDATEVFVSITLNVRDPSDVAQAFMLSIVLEGTNDRIVLNIDQFTQYGTPGYVRSNLYTANITVVGGESYDGTFTVLAITPYTGAHIRFWTARTAKDIIPELNYVDFDMKNIQPDDFNGAALHVEDTGKEMSLRFFNENGTVANRLDNIQTVDIVKGMAHFVPYFCDTEQSDSLSKDMYTVEITYDSGFKYFRPMYCSKSKSDPDKACTKGGDGNTYCSESNPPFHRGPSRKLIDCSGVGQVVYSEKSPEYATNHYECICKDSFTGKSCEQSSCSAGIEHLPQEKDVTFRTLSYVLLSPAGDEACSSLNAFYAKDARKLFDSGNTYPDIWQYTFSVYFTDGTAKTLYRGPSYADFYKVFGTLADTDEETGLDTDNFCGNGSNTKPMDLNDVFNVAVESVGRNSRGVVYLYAAQTFADVEISKNQLVKASDSNELYQSIQAYQQHVYFVSPTITPAFLSMTAASGGFAVRLQDDTGRFNKFKAMFDLILKAQIGWAAVLTEAKGDKNGEISWTITKNSELFITSKSVKGEDAETPSVTMDVTSIVPDVFADEDDDPDDATVSQHATLVATDAVPVKITVKFDEAEKYEFVQVVLLTKEEPIQNALLGQGQGKTDKHAAGAAVNATKAVHISFNKQASQWLFDPAEDNWRQASRVNCSFAQEFVAFSSPFESIGASIVDFTVSPMTTDPTPVPDTNKSFSLAVPLAVSEVIDCVNGDFDEAGSYCECLPDWSGPTCSQPTCQNKGTLNSHGDHCDCSQAEFGGLFCKDPNAVQTTLDPNETTTPDESED